MTNHYEAFVLLELEVCMRLFVVAGVSPELLLPTVAYACAQRRPSAHAVHSSSYCPGYPTFAWCRCLAMYARRLYVMPQSLHLYGFPIVHWPPCPGDRMHAEFLGHCRVA